jgi:transcriptional regulator with XRE-family HTH domain
MGDMSPEGMGAGAARLMEEAPREEPGSAAEAIAELGELAAHDTGRALRMIKGILLGRADPRPEVRRAAAGTLARLCHPDVVTAAQEVLLLFDEESAGKARKARGMSQEELASFLAADQDAPFRRLAAQILLERSDTGEVSGDRAAIVKLLKKRFNEDPNPSVRAVIRLALRRYGEDPGESEFDLHLARMADGSEPLSKGWLGGLKRFVSNW